MPLIVISTSLPSANHPLSGHLKNSNEKWDLDSLTEVASRFPDRKQHSQLVLQRVWKSNDRQW